MKTKHILASSILALVGCIATPTARAQLYVSYDGKISEYDANTGAPISPDFITTGLGLAGGSYTRDLFVSGNTLYAAYPSGGVQTFNATTGAVINPSLMPQGNGQQRLALSGNTLYVGTASGSGFTVNTFNAATGVPINSFAVTPSSYFPDPTFDISVSGNALYLSHRSTGNNASVDVYNAVDGTPIHPNLITLPAPLGLPSLLVSDNNLYVANMAINGVSEYNATTGALNAGFLGTSFPFQPGPAQMALSGNTLYFAVNRDVFTLDATTGATLSHPLAAGGLFDGAVSGLAVATPEPASAALLGLGTLLLAARRRRRA